MQATAFVVKHKGREQIGTPVRDVRSALQRAYDLVADADMKKLSRQQQQELVYTIEDA